MTCRATRHSPSFFAGAVASGPPSRVPRKRRWSLSGQLGLVIDEASVAPAAVWEALPPQRQREVAVRLARLLAMLLEAARDE